MLEYANLIASLVTCTNFALLIGNLCNEMHRLNYAGKPCDATICGIYATICIKIALLRVVVVVDVSN